MLTPIPESDCTRAREAASARLDGELSELEAAYWDAHVLSCPECRRYAAEIGLIAGYLRLAPLEKPAIRFFEPSRTRVVRFPAIAAAAALIAVATVSAFGIGRFVGSVSSRPTTTAASSVLLAPASLEESLAMLNPPAPGPQLAGPRVIPL